MAKKPKAKPKPQRKPGKVRQQPERFKEAAREHGADESGETFERAFRALIPQKRAP